MPYIATLKSVGADPENPNVSVCTIEFSDGQNTSTEIQRGFFTLEQVQNYCREKISKLEKQSVIDAFIANPPIGEVDVALPEPTEEEVKKREEMEALQKLEAEKKRIELTTFNSSDPAFIKARNEYLDKKEATVEEIKP